MEFYQRHPIWGYTRLTTTDNGLLVDRKRLTSYLKVEIPYEELLPLKSKTERSFPVVLTFFMAFCIVGSFVEEIHRFFINPTHVLRLILAAPLTFGACYFTYTRWRNTFTLMSAARDITLVAQPADQQAMEQFLEELRAHVKVYLHQRYAHAWLKLHNEDEELNWDWLYRQKVIPLEELHALKN